ncbi:MAG: DNA repair exonuclease, partial [Pseudomonadota bacterium]
ANRVSLGLLHCDRDQNRGSYAPVRSSELEGAGLDAWFLGHIHKPDALNATARPCGYLGSIAGLDVGETGAHGPWRVDIANGRLSVAPVPLAPLRWEHLDVELEADLPAAHLAGRIVARIRAFHDTLIASPIRPDVVGVRVNLTGRHHDGVALRAALANDDPTELRDDRDGTMYFVESVRLHSQPALDLRALAVGSDPAALLAQRILALRNPKSEHRRRLVAKASKAFGAIGDRPAFAALEPSALGDAELATMLERAATEALERMLSTREGGA